MSILVKSGWPIGSMSKCLFDLTLKLELDGGCKIESPLVVCLENHLRQGSLQGELLKITHLCYTTDNQGMGHISQTDGPDKDGLPLRTKDQPTSRCPLHWRLQDQPGTQGLGIISALSAITHVQRISLNDTIALFHLVTRKCENI